ncbi:zinc transporter ZTP29-like isoform X3 [Carex rostrata]
MDAEVVVALVLSLVGGLSTSIGAFLVILNRTPSLHMLGLLQGFAAGFMLCISFLDLAHNAINSIGFLKANLWFFAGALFFSIIVDIFPEPEISASDVNKKEEKKLSDGTGTNKDLMRRHCRRVVFSVLTSAVVAGISLQNFPEGTASFLGSTKGLHVGLNLALAIALHYIPEGVAVALPAYFATDSKWEAFKLATLAGFAEPLAVIIHTYFQKLWILKYLKAYLDQSVE